MVLASPAFFQLVGVQTVTGRAYAEAEDAAGVAPTAMLSWEFWQRRFGGDPAIVGSTITLNDRSRTIVGVLPRGFHFTLSFVVGSTLAQDVWIPPQFSPAARTASGRYLQVLARLAPGVSRDAAQLRMAALAKQLEQQFPSRQAGWGVNIVPLQEQTVGDVRRALLIIFGAVGFVLLIACANVANLLLSRAAERHQEVAVRAALGAGRGRIALQLMTESLVLAATGGLLGVGLAAWAVRVLKLMGPSIPRLDTVSLNSGVLAFAAVTTLLAGALFGMAPVLHVIRSDLAGWLKGRLGMGGSRESRRTRSALVVAEIALSLVLLIGAGLLIRSLLRLIDTGVGFDTGHLLTAQIELPSARYPQDADHVRFFDDLITRVRAQPGVQSASAITFAPLGGSGSATSFWANDRAIPEPGRFPVADVRWVHRDYHRVMGIPLVTGRYFDASDRAGTPYHILVSQATVAELWPGQNPLGKIISMPWGDTLVAEVVGVVQDVRTEGPATAPRSMLYWNYEQFQSFPFMTVLVRTAGDPLAFTSTLRSAVHAIDPQLPVFDVKTMDARFSDALTRARFGASALASFAVIALLLACVGIYGVMSYITGQRTQEFGVRMAMGATTREVVGLVLGEGARLVALALGIGMAAALLLARLLRTLVFEVGTTDPVTFGIMSALLAVTALAACWLPARRAARVDPVRAMRMD